MAKNWEEVVARLVESRPMQTGSSGVFAEREPEIVRSPTLRAPFALMAFISEAG